MSPGKESFILDDGKDVIAEEGMATPSPWIVLPSKNFQGTFYFKNTETNESLWTLPLTLFYSCGEKSAESLDLASFLHANKSSPVLETEDKKTDAAMNSDSATSKDGSIQKSHEYAIEMTDESSNVGCGALGESHFSGSSSRFRHKCDTATTVGSAASENEETEGGGTINTQLNEPSGAPSNHSLVVSLPQLAASSRSSSLSPKGTNSDEHVANKQRNTNHKRRPLQGYATDSLERPFSVDESKSIDVTPKHNRRDTTVVSQPSPQRAPAFLAPMSNMFKNLSQKFPSWRSTGSSNPPSLAVQRSEVSISNSSTLDGSTVSSSRNDVSSYSSQLTSLPAIGNAQNYPRSIPRMTEHFSSPPLTKKYQVLGGLGRGGFSMVVFVEKIAPLASGGGADGSVRSGDGGGGGGGRLVSSNIYAMKVVPKIFSRKLVKREKHKRQIRTEMEVMHSLNESPFLVKCHDVFENYSCVFFVIDFVAGGDLFYHLKDRFDEVNCKPGFFTVEETRFILAEVFAALEYMHSKSYLHRDLKVENIMLTGDGHAKLVDYGMAMKFNSYSQRMEPAGSLMYMAPELLFENTGGRHTDWWAFGVLTFEMLTGRAPWSSLDNADIINIEIREKQVKLSPESFPPCVVKMVNKLLCNDATRRLGSMSDIEVKKCSFFKSIDWQLLANLQLQPPFVPSSRSSSSNLCEEDAEDTLKLYHIALENERKHQEKLESEVVYDADHDRSWGLGLPDAAHYLV